MTSGLKAPIVDLTPDLGKIVEAILLILEAASNRGKTLTQYEIVKTLFFADRHHLNEYGRPITFDNYKAMKHGPVPNFAYNLLRGDSYELSQLDFDLPWIATPIPGKKAKNYTATHAPDADALSPSEIEAIEDSLTVVLTLGFGQVKRLTHEDAAYVEAWGGDETTSYPMSLALLFDEPNFDLAEDLQYLSQFGSN